MDFRLPPKNPLTLVTGSVNKCKKSKSHGSIDEMIHSLEVKEIDSIPNEILELEFDKEDSWIVGGFLSLDLVLSI